MTAGIVFCPCGYSFPDNNLIIKTVILYYINPNTKEILNKYNLETEYCEIGKNIDKSLIDKYNFTDYKNYLCINRNFDFDIIINKTHSVYIDIVISNFNEITKYVVI